MPPSPSKPAGRFWRVFRWVLVGIALFWGGLMLGNWALLLTYQQSDLTQMLARADRLVVRQDRFKGGGKLLYETTRREDLSALADAAQIIPPEIGFLSAQAIYCSCSGSPVISIYQGENLLGTLSNHHGTLIRFSPWDSDVGIVDQEQWLGWFDARGISGPREEVEESRQRAQKFEQDELRWQAAMPRGLAMVWESALDEYGVASLDVLRPTLLAALPDQNDRLLALLHWYGSGAGPWSGYPSYECAAGNLLVEYSPEALIAIASDRALTPTQREGAARLFAGRSFSRKHPEVTLPAELKQSLLLHTEATGDRDNIDRARRAFSNTP